ncbi:hypothetical protein [Microbacterium rhizomatis]|uniref:MFS transporter n=1 Tax=Microbacterium rhizomatis TaxID=1631477 RepID=A0A5J5J0P2_9MICO|nr:hypothetical protein [Microbacterium rhizomatis]KAA9106052.1 hypothetical protein F6B43_16990 [Microbacterium rhizomatis]
MTTEVSTTATASPGASEKYVPGGKLRRYMLPDPTSAGRDLGMAAIGQNFGSALGPLLAGAVVAFSSGFYGYVWPVAFVTALLAAIAILPIKGVR